MSVLKIVNYLWQLPQLILGNIILRICLKIGLYTYYDHDINRLITIWCENAGLSLGNYIFLPKHYTSSILKHEYGHSRQSVMLGPLYLIIIGIPSVLHFWIYRLLGKRWNYYKFYTELWADKLGRVTR